jgi:molybdopterin/thiamine biosynthesis adenylyltransferase/ubiquitin-protein ligase
MILASQITRRIHPTRRIRPIQNRRPSRRTSVRSGHLPWYERYPERLTRELQALRDCRIEVTEDADAKARGVIKLALKYTWEGETYDLEALYPDFFPYSQPEVSGERLNLRRHWNPNGGNICLIGRDSIQWNVDATLAEVISERLPEILRFHRDGNPEQIRAVEVPQGEPISEYFSGAGTRNSFALFDSSWTIPDDVKAGTMEAVGFYRKVVGAPGAPCLVIKRILDEHGKEVCAWQGPPLDRAWRNGAYRIPWARVEPPPSGSIQEIGEAYVEGRLGIRKANISRANRQGLFAIVYEEEVQQFELGWGLSVFEWLFNNHTKLVELRPVRTFRCGQQDLAARMPSVAALSGKHVLLCGLGALGSNTALELARNGIGQLDVVDFDYVEPATTRRWVAGIDEFGKDKTEAVQEVLGRNYPWTAVKTHTIRIGGLRPGPDAADQFDQIAELVGAADAVVDMTAEVTANHILADMAAWASKPYVVANATPGAWGGMVFQVRPAHDDACWMCMRTSLYPDSDNLPVADPDGLIHPPGCAARTFSGTSFDLAEIIDEAIRVICGILGSAYPLTTWQLGVCNLRSKDGGRIPPNWRGLDIKRRKGCACLA